MEVKLEDKFIGCMLGALVGDCFGNPFELSGPKPESVACFLKEKLAVQDPTKEEVLFYTDNTEMARSVAESLLACKDFNASDMAKRFVKEYSGPQGAERGYGSHVHTVFRTLMTTGFEGDVFAPARNQFGGEGSLGNGGAMRTHPVPLFCHGKDQDAMLHICRQTARITHNHIDGYNGAILQSLAVRQALDADPNQPLDQMDFLKRLRTVLAELESTRPAIPYFPSFCEQIDKIKSLLEDKKGNPSVLGRGLGTDETATLSLPAAIFCFLRSQESVKDFPTENPFLRTLYLSISLGGDTDTIATMACAISGAYHGRAYVPEILYRQCESWKDILDKAQRLTAVVSSGPSE